MTAPAQTPAFAELSTPERVTSTPNLGGLDGFFAEYGKKPPRFRELEVSDEHALYLLMLVTQDQLAKRNRGETDYAGLEMMGALTALVQS